MASEREPLRSGAPVTVSNGVLVKRRAILINSPNEEALDVVVGGKGVRERGLVAG